MNRTLGFYDSHAADAWEHLHEGAGFRTIDLEETDDIVGRPGIRWATFLARRR